jgi:hypothetical protein
MAKNSTTPVHLPVLQQRVTLGVRWWVLALAAIGLASVSVGLPVGAASATRAHVDASPVLGMEAQPAGSLTAGACPVRSPDVGKQHPTAARSGLAGACSPVAWQAVATASSIRRCIIAGVPLAQRTSRVQAVAPQRIGRLLARLTPCNRLESPHGHSGRLSAWPRPVQLGNSS